MNLSRVAGPWALIAGGSEGVGASFALRLAAAGLNLVLIARKAVPLDDLAADIRARHPGCELRLIPADLCNADDREGIKAVTADIEIGCFIYNAGAASRTGPFCDEDPAFLQQMVALNIVAKIDLTHHFAGAMRQRGRGTIVLIGSMSGLGGTPGIGVYSGVKAFGINFAEALWAELKPIGIDVLGFLLGPTNTPAIARHYPDQALAGDAPDVVADQALAMIGHGPIGYVESQLQRVHAYDGMSRAEAVAARGARAAAYMPKASGTAVAVNPPA